MKSLWHPAVRAELLARAARLTPDHRPRWGRMTAEQMLSHLVQTCRMGTGELPIRRVARSGPSIPRSAGFPAAPGRDSATGTWTIICGSSASDEG